MLSWVGKCGGRLMNIMRFTVVDARGTISFVSDCKALPAMVASCSLAPSSLEELLRGADRFGISIADFVSSGLAVFDEHNAYGNYTSIHAAIENFPGHELPVFRVVDDVTRRASLQPIMAGAVLFNLKSRRIVQLQNTYRDIRGMVAKIRQLEQGGWRILP